MGRRSPAVRLVTRRDPAARGRVYDPQTRSELQTGQAFPGRNSTRDPLHKNADGSITLTFGPTTPDDQPGNWIQTVPDKKWFTLLRLYGPLEPWLDTGCRGVPERGLAHSDE